MIFKQRILPALLALALILIPIQAFGFGWNGGADAGDWGQIMEGSFFNGQDGVRVSVVLARAPYTTKASADFSNYDTTAIETRGRGPMPVSIYGEGQMNKFQLDSYGFEIGFDSYSALVPTTELPKMIGVGGTTLRDYFLQAGTLKDYSNLLGVSEDLVLSGDYNLVLEPIAYFAFEWTMYGLTATEAAHLNAYTESAASGRPPAMSLRKQMGALVSKNLPLSSYLTKDAMDINKFTGPTGNSTYYSNQMIIDKMGIAILSAADFGGGGAGSGREGGGYPEGDDDKPGDDGGTEDGEEDGGQEDIDPPLQSTLIPSEYINKLIDRTKEIETPTVTFPEDADNKTGPDLNNAGPITTKHLGNTSYYQYGFHEWGMDTKYLINRQTVTDGENQLRIAGAVHPGQPPSSSVGWMGNGAFDRPEKERVYSLYDWSNVPKDENNLGYEYSYTTEESPGHDGCSQDPITGSYGHPESDHDYTENHDGTGAVGIQMPALSFSAKNTVFNSPNTLTLVTTTKVTHDTNTRRANLTAAIPGTDVSLKFFPYYAMKYWHTATSEGPSTAWMLATGERTLNTKDMFSIDLQSSDRARLIAPWSRDKQDLQNCPSTVRNVLKAGSAIQVIPPAITGQITYTYYIQDPGFVRSSSTIEIKPEAISAFEKLLQGDAMDLVVYSNVPYTGSLMQYPTGSMDLTVNNGIIADSIATSYKQKPRPGAISAIKRFDPGSITVTATRNNSIQGIQSRVNSPIQQSVSIAGRYVPVDIRTGVLEFMDVGKGPTSLLQPGRDIEDNVLPWYKEEYEGLIKIEIKGDFSMREDPNSLTWFEVHPHISDWLSGYNTKQNPYNVVGGQMGPIYQGTDFIMGVGIAVNPLYSPTGSAHFIPNPAYAEPFQIRDSVFSNTK